MNEEFVYYSLAKKLKEKGFKFNKDYRLDRFFMANEINTPTIAQAMKWLREEKKIHVGVELINDYSSSGDGNVCKEWTYWSFAVYKIKYGVIYRNYDNLDDIEYQSYESAALAGIEYVFDNLI